MKKNYTLLLVIMLLMPMLLFSQQRQTKIIGYSQDSDQPIDVGVYDEKLFADVLLIAINNYMDTVGYDVFEKHDFFVEAARQHAQIMAEEEKASVEGRGAYSTPEDRLIMIGGTGIGDELVLRSGLREGDVTYTYAVLAERILFRWIESGKSSRVLFSGKYNFAGISSCLDENNKRLYISVYLGNYESFKQGAHKFGDMEYPYTTKRYRLQPYEERTCRKADRRMPNMVDLQENIEVSPSGEIIFKFGDLRTFKKFLRGKRDGLAVDIVQKSQFTDCDSENIVDFEQNNRGIMTKRIWSKKIFKKNIAEPDPEDRRGRVKRLEVVLGHMPEGLSEDEVELNLMVIKDKKVCANIAPSYLDKGIYAYSQKLDLMPDTIGGKDKYVPEATSNKLEFRIPFEQGKFEYDSEDMVPVIEALNEPSFIINKIFITAYSSLEGSEQENSVLQRKRANSIVNALVENQNASMVDSIVTLPNWDDLKTDVKGTAHEKLAEMTYHEAIQYVNANAGQMEPILENHRYANVVVWVTYDIDGDKEQEYVVKQFNDAVEADNLDYALSIQKHIFNRVAEGRYNSKAVTNMRIPNGRKYVGLNMNKICLRKIVYLDPIDSTYLEQVDNLFKLDGTNPYVRFNDLFCEVKLTNMGDTYAVEELQDRIDMLYDSEINKRTVDLLNIELQYQIMDVYKDSLGFEHPVVVQSLDRIKRIIDFDEINWQNSLKLAGVFVNHGDYEYAFGLLDPWIDEEIVNVTLLTTYISLCTKVDKKIYSNKFVLALEKLRKHDQKTFCKLFKGDKLSVQTFANTKVKEMYCNECK
jgi:outer membrane protein OmpA-like peptidoglycan-associated protein